MTIAAEDVNKTMSGAGRGDEVVFDLVTACVAAGWTLTDSNDGSDFAVTSAGSGGGGLGNSNAWMLMTKPLTGVGPIDNPTQIGFQRGASNQSWKMKIYPTGGATGGTDTTLPTSGDSFFCQNQINSDTFTDVFFGGVSRYHIRVLAADEGHGFDVAMHNDGLTTFSSNGMLGMDPVTQHHPDDTHPWVFYANNVSPVTNTLFSQGAHGVALSEQPQITVDTFNFLEHVDTSNVGAWPGGLAQSEPSGDDPALQCIYAKRGSKHKGLSTFFYNQGPPRSTGIMYTDGAQANAYVALGSLYATRWTDNGTLIL